MDELDERDGIPPPVVEVAPETEDERIDRMIASRNYNFKTVAFRCTSPACHAIDFTRVYSNEPINSRINCMTCRAGYKKHPEQMAQGNLGAILLDEAEADMLIAAGVKAGQRDPAAPPVAVRSQQRTGPHPVKSNPH